MKVFKVHTEFQPRSSRVILEVGEYRIDEWFRGGFKISSSEIPGLTTPMCIIVSEKESVDYGKVIIKM